MDKEEAVERQPLCANQAPFILPYPSLTYPRGEMKPAIIFNNVLFPQPEAQASIQTLPSEIPG